MIPATIADAVKRYGPIDFASKVWPAQAHFITMFQVPPGQFPNWTVMDTGIPVHHIACNVDIQPLLSAALDSLYSRNLGNLLITFDGCLNIRPIRGTVGQPSAHSYGLALDLNAASNPLSATSGGLYLHPEFVKCWTDAGFFWGGNFSGRKDPMHFSALNW